jgi:hypothetical protein
VQEANSKSINDNLISAVALLGQILNATSSKGGSALSGSSGGVKTASSGSGMAGGAGNAIGGTSDTTSA